jgi:hypothetical protein
MENKVPPFTHLLKTVNPHFTNVWLSDKTFEIRKNDRDFQVGHFLRLVEYTPESGSYPTGRGIQAYISHILTHEDFPQGLQPGYVCMSIKLLCRIYPD